VLPRYVRARERGTVLYPLEGHVRTGITGPQEHPLSFSRILNCKLVTLFHQDTVSGSSYETFECGETVERFAFNPGAGRRFWSRRHQVDLAEWSNLSDVSDPGRSTRQRSSTTRSKRSDSLPFGRSKCPRSSAGRTAARLRDYAPTRPDDFTRVNVVGGPSPGEVPASGLTRSEAVADAHAPHRGPALNGLRPQ
jgi:hypothetical protein